MAAPMPAVDLRSDTVTRPTSAMRAAIAAAEVGDDVFGDDPTVNALQARMAALLGKEAALFVTSGTQANLCALLAHGGRGDAVLLGEQSHICRWEAGGASVLGGLLLRPLRQGADGRIALADIDAQAAGDDDPHVAPTRLLALENTWNGHFMPTAYLDEMVAAGRRHGLAAHLDGARLFNAAVVLAGVQGDPFVAARRFAEPFDSVSVCFSKGLGAPAGSVLVGPRALIARAYRARKLLGGALRQSGLLAAAAIHALDHHVHRLTEDHANARRLADGLAGLEGVSVEPPQTNMVWVDLDPHKAPGAVERLRAAGVWCTGGGGRLRLVTHLDTDTAAIDRAVAALRLHL